MVDQDGFSLFVAAAALTILVSGLIRGTFEIQFLRTPRASRPFLYWLTASALIVVALEGLRRAWFIGCIEC